MSELARKESGAADRRRRRRAALRADSATERFALGTTTLSTFARAADLAELRASSDDAILRVPTEPRHAHILKLADARFIPEGAIARIADAKRHAPPQGLDYYSDRDSGTRPHLLFGKGGAIIPDSFLRSAKVNASIAYDGAGGWSFLGPAAFKRIDRPCLFLELYAGSFGHTLVDTPARLWPLELFDSRTFDDLLFVVRPIHARKRKIVGDTVSRINAALGLKEAKLHWLTEPTAFSTLYVPSRISPYRSESGPLYARTMAAAGDRLAAEDGSAVINSRKVFLSRSKVEKRPLEPAAALRLERLFANGGYAIVHPQDLPLGEQVRLIRQATHVAGLEGSQLHLTAFRDAPGLRLIRIHANYRVAQTDHAIARFNGTHVTDLPIEIEEAPADRLRMGWMIKDGDFARIADVLRSL